jgi:hypothetical protein
MLGEIEGHNNIYKILNTSILYLTDRYIDSKKVKIWMRRLISSEKK